VSYASSVTAPRWIWGASLTGWALAGCSPAEPPGTAATTTGGATGAGGGAVCAPGTGRADDGSCVPAGVPASACGAGFTPERDGCTPILPATACGKGQMAVPGETTCRPVAPCGAGKYDGIPIDATTQFVDASFTGASDGSEAAPWPTISQAVSAAAPGGIIAVAAGQYDEAVDIAYDRVQLWGVCPAEVTIAPPGTDAMTRALTVRGAGTTGTEVRRVGITSHGIGVGIFAATDVVLDEVWIHDTGYVALAVQGTTARTEATLSASLIEDAMTLGALSAADAELTITDSVIRGARSEGGIDTGLALQVEYLEGSAASAVIRGSVFEKNDSGALYFLGGAGTIDASVVRDNGTIPHAVAIEVDQDKGSRASATIRGSVVERNHSVGIIVGGSDAVIESTTVRDMSEDLEKPKEGYGVAIKNALADPTMLGNLTMSACLVEKVKQVGIAVIGSDAAIDRTLVRDVTPIALGQIAWGIDFYNDPGSTAVGTLSLTASVVEDVPAVGVIVQSSPATIDGVRISNLLGIEGTFGDGIDVWSEAAPASLTLTSSLIEGATRAGVASFGSTVSIADTVLECDQIVLDGEGDYDFDDRGGNTCRCDGTTEACKVLSSMLVPPPPPE